MKRSFSKWCAVLVVALTTLLGVAAPAAASTGRLSLTPASRNTTNKLCKSYNEHQSLWLVYVVGDSRSPLKVIIDEPPYQRLTYTIAKGGHLSTEGDYPLNTVAVVTVTVYSGNGVVLAKASMDGESYCKRQ